MIANAVHFAKIATGEVEETRVATPKRKSRKVQSELRKESGPEPRGAGKVDRR